MIRVITIDSQDRFYDCDRVIELKNACIDYENETVWYDGDWERDMLWFGEIIKIEKQVKDLTLEEMGKLHLAEKYTNSNFTKLEGAVHLGTYKIYKLDDYIDITDLVKRC